MPYTYRKIAPVPAAGILSETSLILHSRPAPSLSKLRGATLFVVLAAILNTVVFFRTAHAQWAANIGDITFNPVAGLTQTPSGPTLIGGVPADPTKWLATFYSGQDTGSCTSNLVGPRALLLAAHCVGDGRKATLRLRDGATVAGTCKHAAGYRTDTSADYALCLMTKALDGIQFEVVNADPSLLRKNQPILLSGYGCTQSPGVGGNDGIFRIGEVTLVETPDPSRRWPNYIVTKGEVAVCYGDSGGGAFVTNSAGGRRLISVNSRGNIDDTSYLSATSTAAALTFMRAWATENNAAICGLTAGMPAGSCHP